MTTNPPNPIDREDMQASLDSRFPEIIFTRTSRPMNKTPYQDLVLENTRLESENETLRQRVEQLEAKLAKAQVAVEAMEALRFVLDTKHRIDIAGDADEIFRNVFIIAFGERISEGRTLEAAIMAAREQLGGGA